MILLAILLALQSRFRSLAIKSALSLPNTAR